MSVSMDWHGEEAAAAIKAALEEGLDDALGALKGWSQEGTPVLTGELRDDTRAERDGLSGGVGLGLEWADLRHESGYADLQSGQRKFLGEPFNERAPELLEKIADPVRRLLD